MEILKKIWMTATVLFDNREAVMKIISEIRQKWADDKTKEDRDQLNEMNREVNESHLAEEV